MGIHEEAMSDFANVANANVLPKSGPDKEAYSVVEETSSSSGIRDQD